MKIRKWRQRAFYINHHWGLPIYTSPRLKRRVKCMIVNDGHRSSVSNTVFVAFPIIARLCRILVGAISRWGKVLAAALGSLLEEIVLFVRIISHPTWIVPTETLREAKRCWGSVRCASHFVALTGPEVTGKDMATPLCHKNHSTHATILLEVRKVVVYQWIRVCEPSFVFSLGIHGALIVWATRPTLGVPSYFITVMGAYE